VRVTDGNMWEDVMRQCNTGRVAAVYLAAAVAVLTLAAAAPAQAHHAMGGGTPATLAQGLLSGLAHPVIGIDHLAFVVAMGVAVGVAGLNLAIPLLFIAASALGVALHVQGLALPVAEPIVAASVLIVGAAVAWGGKLGSWAWLSLFAIAGLFHGYAFGESVVGAERTPLVAYLAGLVIVQGAIATGIALASRRSRAGAVAPRLAGAAVAGVGFAILAGQLLPA
jgi:urease accessory protein